jgi:prepilin signal peptidase PulO-like enzyme (type II secretory pathway)
MLTYQLLAAVLGLIVGSFLNVVILRLPRGESLSTEPSHCPRCRHRLSPWELVPVISFLALRGRCRACHRRISWQYPLVELATAVLFVLAIMLSPSFGWAAFAAFVGAVCVVVFMIDLREHMILDQVMLPAMAVVVVGNLLLQRPALDWLSGAILGGGFFFLQYTISRGRWVGGGDIRFGMFLGLVLGLANTGLALFLAYISGAVLAVLLMLAHRKRFGSVLPFGTFLSVATLVTLYWGAPILSWYHQGGLLDVLGLNMLIDQWVVNQTVPLP